MSRGKGVDPRQHPELELQMSLYAQSTRDRGPLEELMEEFDGPRGRERMLDAAAMIVHRHQAAQEKLREQREDPIRLGHNHVTRELRADCPRCTLLRAIVPFDKIEEMS